MPTTSSTSSLSAGRFFLPCQRRLVQTLCVRRVIELDEKTFNFDIIKNKDRHQSSQKLEETKKVDLLYACSEFVVNTVQTITGFQIPYILHPISNEDRILASRRIPQYVTMINIHASKGGKIFLECIRQLPNIPFFGVQTESSSDETDRLIREAIEKRNSDPRTKNCVLITRTENIKEIYSQTKILMIPSLVDETFCKVAQEGLCNGIPIISSSQGYLKYMLQDASIVMDSLKSNDWVKTVNNLYHSPQDLKKYSQKAQERYISFYSEKIAKETFTQFITSCCRSIARIMLFVPWADQGLGIQARNYTRFFLDLGYEVVIFSFRSYFSKDSLRYQKDEKEWNIPEVRIYYSDHDRESVTDEEITKIIQLYDVRYLWIVETCFHRVFEIAQLAQNLGVRTVAIPNLETVRTSEIDDHSVFDDILCNNRFTYNIFQSLGFDNIYYLGYALYSCQGVNEISSKPFPIKFLCICGLNSIVRKQASRVIEAFKSALNRGLQKATLTITVQGSQIPNIDSELLRDSRIQIIIKHLTGKEIKRLYQTHHVFIQVSKHEGLGLGFHEALAYSLPVITLNAQPHNEIVRPECGWIIPCYFQEMQYNKQGLIKSAIFHTSDLAKCFLKAAKEYTKEKGYKARQNYLSRYNKDDFRQRLRRLIELLPVFHGRQR